MGIKQTLDSGTHLALEASVQEGKRFQQLLCAGSSYMSLPHKLDWILSRAPNTGVRWPHSLSDEMLTSVASVNSSFVFIAAL